MTESPSYFLNQIYFYLTKGCNLRCRHCWIMPEYQLGNDASGWLDFSTFCAVIEQGVELGLTGVKLTGGEPLMHPRIGDILRYLRAKNLALTIETNGVFCTPQLAREMRECKTPFVSVSLDGATREVHEWMRGVEGCFEAALIGIRNLVASELRPQIIMAVANRNKHQLSELAAFAESLGADSVKFNIVHPMGRGQSLSKAGETLSVEEILSLGRWVENELSESTQIPLYFSYPPAFRPLSRMFGDESDGCDQCGILGIVGVLADGSYALCGIGATVPELIFGNAAKDALGDVWRDSPILREIRAGLPGQLQGVCGDCLMKSICLGCCIAQNFSQSNNLWGPYWLCEEARNQGLFPNTRLRTVHGNDPNKEGLRNERLASQI